MAACSNHFHFPGRVLVDWSVENRTFISVSGGESKTISEINAIMESYLDEPVSGEGALETRKLNLAIYRDLAEVHA